MTVTKFVRIITPLMCLVFSGVLAATNNWEHGAWGWFMFVGVWLYIRGLDTETKTE